MQPYFVFWVVQALLEWIEEEQTYSVKVVCLSD